MKKTANFILLVILSVGLTLIMERSGWLTPVENFYYDAWHQLAGQRFEPAHAVIVAVDQATLFAHKDEPLAFWGPHFAKVIQTLRAAGVRSIGIDFLFSVSAESWLKRLQLEDNRVSRTYDIGFREELNRGDVLLTAIAVQDGESRSGLILPVMEYLFSLPNIHGDIGLANLYSDDDEVIRSFVPKILDGTDVPTLTFAPLLAERAAGNALWEASQANLPRRIGYAGPPGTYPRLSFEQLLTTSQVSEDLAAQCKGKVAIIAVESIGTQDVHITPYMFSILGKHTGVMSGAEIHANIIDTLLNDRSPNAVTLAAGFLWLVFMTAIGALLFLHRKPIFGFCFWTLLNLSAALTAYALFHQNRLLPVADIHFSLTLAYVGAIGFRLTREERTRHRMRQAIGPYVSEAIVDQLLESDRLPNLGGETFQVTILFSDIRNFTTISEFLTAEQVVDMLNNYYSRICEPIFAQGGMIDKFIGDAVMAVFGAPVAHPDFAGRAVRAAIEMEKIALEFQAWMDRQFPEKQLPAFRIGIGLHTGPAVIGNVGSQQRMGYTAIGDTVNIASRLESMSKSLGWTIVASRETVVRAGAGIVTGASDTVSVKGRIGAIDVLEVLGGLPALPEG